MADVAQMDLRPFDLIDFDGYQDGGSGSGKDYAPPPEGVYTAKAPVIKDDGTDVISDTNSFGRTREGYLKVGLDVITLLDGPKPGYEIRYTTLSSKKYAKRMGSQVFDFLRACGIAARPTSETELRQAVRQASGRPFQFSLVWEAYNKDSQETISGAVKFPDDPNNPGSKLSYIIDEFDSSKRWFANGKVKYFKSAISA